MNENYHNLLLMDSSHAAFKFIDILIAILYDPTLLWFPLKLQLELESVCLIMKRSLHSQLRLTSHQVPRVQVDHFEGTQTAFVL